MMQLNIKNRIGFFDTVSVSRVCTHVAQADLQFSFPFSSF